MLAATAMLASGAAAAQSEGSGSQPDKLLPPAQQSVRTLYAGAGLAVQSVTGFQDGYAAVGKVGTFFSDARESFGAELEFSHSLIEPESNGGGRWGGGGNDVNLTTMAGYGTFTVRHPEQPLAVRARLGLAWEYADPDAGDSESELNVSYGIGGTADLASGVTMFVDYTHIEADVEHLNIGVQARF
jgi:hypothetical protein